MKNLVVIFFITLITLVQIGSSSFSFYTNTCFTSGNSSISLEQKKCCCNKHKPTIDTGKKCCSKNQKCCSKKSSSQDKISKTCCVSTQHVVQTSNEYSNSKKEINSRIYTTIVYEISTIKTNLLPQLKVHLYKYNPPPRQGVDLRVFIQSFQI